MVSMTIWVSPPGVVMVNAWNFRSPSWMPPRCMFAATIAADWFSPTGMVNSISDVSETSTICMLILLFSLVMS